MSSFLDLVWEVSSVTKTIRSVSYLGYSDSLVYGEPLTKFSVYTFLNKSKEPEKPTPQTRQTQVKPTKAKPPKSRDGKLVQKILSLKYNKKHTHTYRSLIVFLWGNNLIAEC